MPPMPRSVRVGGLGQGDYDGGGYGNRQAVTGWTASIGELLPPPGDTNTAFDLAAFSTTTPVALDPTKENRPVNAVSSVSASSSTFGLSSSNRMRRNSSGGTAVAATNSMPMLNLGIAGIGPFVDDSEGSRPCSPTGSNTSNLSKVQVLAALKSIKLDLDHSLRRRSSIRENGNSEPLFFQSGTADFGPVPSPLLPLTSSCVAPTGISRCAASSVVTTATSTVPSYSSRSPPLPEVNDFDPKTQVIFSSSTSTSNSFDHAAAGCTEPLRRIRHRRQQVLESLLENGGGTNGTSALTPTTNSVAGGGINTGQDNGGLIPSYPLIRKAAKKRKEARFSVLVEKTKMSPMDLKHRRKSNPNHPGDRSTISISSISLSLGGNNAQHSGDDQLGGPPTTPRFTGRGSSHTKKPRSTPVVGTVGSSGSGKGRSRGSSDNGGSNSSGSSRELFTCAVPIPMDSVFPILTCSAITSRPHLKGGSGANSSKSKMTDHTVRELMSLKKELRQLRRMATLREEDVIQPPVGSAAALLMVRAPRINSTNSKSSGNQLTAKSVRFAQPVVTMVKHRPFTAPEDIEKLFFVPEELDVLEWDRETTEGDQFECVAQTAARHKLVVSVSFKNRKRDFALATSIDGTEPSIYYSPSDLSAMKE